MNYAKLLKGGVGSGRHAGYTGLDTFKHVAHNAKTLVTMPLSELQEHYQRAKENLKRFQKTRNVSPFATGAHMLGLKEEQENVMTILDTLNARLAVKKQAPQTALDLVSKAAENYAVASHNVLKGGVGSGRHSGFHNLDITSLHSRSDKEIENSDKLKEGNYPTGYHVNQSNTHEDLASAFRSHGLQYTAKIHDLLAEQHDKLAGGDGSGLAQNKISKSVENYAVASQNVLKGGAGSGRHKGNESVDALHKRSNTEIQNSHQLRASKFPTGYHVNQSSTHEDLASAFRSHGLENEAKEHDKLAAIHDKLAGGDGSGLAQNKVSKSEYEEVLKYGIKGMRRGVRNQKPTNGDATSKEAVTAAFNKSGSAYTPNTNVDNSISHSKKDFADLHEGDMHGHLTDNGFKHTSTDNHSGGTTSQYEHPNGAKVAVTNNGSSLSFQHTDGKPPAPLSDKEKDNIVAARANAGMSPLPLAAARRDPSAVGADGKLDSAKFAKGVRRIASMTDGNDHSGAVLHGAKLTGNKDFIARAKDIRDQHIKAGHMPPELNAKRYALSKEIQEHVNRIASPEQAKAFYGAY